MRNPRYPVIAVKLLFVSLLCWNGMLQRHCMAYGSDSKDGSAMNSGSQAEITATRLTKEIQLDAAHPAKEWDSAAPVHFSADWQGKNADPALETEVRVLWSAKTLYLRFVCHYRAIFVFDDSEPNGRRDYLWDRDVAEAFLQPPESVSKSASDASATNATHQRVIGDYDTPYAHYKEFEIAPNGMWIDLDIVPAGRGDLRSGLARSVHVDEQHKIWTAEMAIPMQSLTANFNPQQAWRVNFYRVEGKAEPRKYMAWQPTMTPQANFHVPEKFGTLRFAD